MSDADASSRPAITAVAVPIGMQGQAIPFDPRGTMEAGELVEASRLAYPAVALQPTRKDGLGMAAGGAAAVLLGLAAFLGMSSGREGRQVAPPPAPVPANQTPTSVIPPPTPDQLAALNGAAQPATGSLVFRSPAPGYSPVVVTPQGQPHPGGSMADRLRSPTLLFDDSGPVLPTAVEGAAPTAAGAAPRAITSAGDEFFAKADASASDTATARPMANPASTVSQGTLIPAVLETAMNSDLPGYVRAVVSQDVRSFDGSQILIPRSSRLIGQYKSGLAAGQTRAYVLWSRLIRPDGVSVAIASPGTDEAGQSGLAGEVNSHFFKRFGSALLLSVVGAASAIGTSGSSVLMQGGGLNAAGVATQQSGAIPPTVKVRQGQPIRVFTARDLDFSRVAAATVER